VGIFPWGPVLDRNFTVPRDGWYEGWREKDWNFMWDTPEELIRRGKFNRGLSYMSGVTTQEAAFFICKCNTFFVTADRVIACVNYKSFHTVITFAIQLLHSATHCVAFCQILGVVFNKIVSTS
jgi:hypothetical protein